MLRNKVHSRKLTTWRTKVCCSCFPYGYEEYIRRQLIALAANRNFYLYRDTCVNVDNRAVPLRLFIAGNLLDGTAGAYFDIYAEGADHKPWDSASNNI